MTGYRAAQRKRIRMRETKGTPAFARAYADAVDKLEIRTRVIVGEGPPTHPKRTARPPRSS
jgi:hypothetical protein